MKATLSSRGLWLFLSTVEYVTQRGFTESTNYENRLKQWTSQWVRKAWDFSESKHHMTGLGDWLQLRCKWICGCEQSGISNVIRHSGARTWQLRFMSSRVCRVATVYAVRF